MLDSPRPASPAIHSAPLPHAENSRASKYIHNVKQSLQNPLGRGAEMSPEDQNISALVTRLQEIFLDVGLYKKLLSCRGSDAQKLLDAFQWLLDIPDIESAFRRRLLVAMQRISNKSGRYPACYELEGVVQEGEHPVAAGGFADIYKGSFQGQMVCMKAIRIYQNTDMEDFMKQFAKEAVLWGQLSHPNVVPIYGLFHVQNRVCLISPWMDFGDITKYLKRQPKAHRPHLALDVAKGLFYLHENGIIHGDLKGPNILVNDDGIACLADFGISSVSESAIPVWTSHSSMASRGGSVRWQAPELFDTENDEMVKNSVKSDIYALSCVFYEIFTGTVPFENIHLDTAVALKIMSGTRPARPSNSSRCWQDWGLTEAVWSLMEQCWRPAPLERPGVEQIIDWLGPRLVRYEKRPSTSGSILPPACFRQRVSQPLDLLTVSLLDDMLDCDVETNAANPGGVPASPPNEDTTQPLIIPSSSSSPPLSTVFPKGKTKMDTGALVNTVRMRNGDSRIVTKKEAKQLQKKAEALRRILAESTQRQQARAVMQKRDKMMRQTRDTNPQWRGLGGPHMAGW